MIVPDGPLTKIPFEMLVLNNGGRTGPDISKTHVREAKFFGEQHPISYYHSIGSLTDSRKYAADEDEGRQNLGHG